jgi:hypothetical protein
MTATVIHAAGDVRVEDVPDAVIVEPTDALVRVTRACICEVLSERGEEAAARAGTRRRRGRPLRAAVRQVMVTP